MSPLKIIIGSTRPNSIEPAIGAWVADQATRVGDFDQVGILDPAEINLPLALTPAR